MIWGCYVIHHDSDIDTERQDFELRPYAAELGLASFDLACLPVRE